MRLVNNQMDGEWRRNKVSDSVSDKFVAMDLDQNYK